MKPAPQRNRVQPTGEIIAAPARGLFMGNRGGALQDTGDRLARRPWANKTWLVCDLAFSGRSRANTGRARYTKLFFLDEAVAFAAGHRPCAFCRRNAFNAFCKAWGDSFGAIPRAADIDGRLHDERIDPATGAQKRTDAALEHLPDGALVIDPASGTPALLWRNLLLPYAPTGYGPPIVRPAQAAVVVLTPPAALAVLRAGYRPTVHPSATT